MAERNDRVEELQQEQMKESPGEYENRIAIEVANEFVSVYKMAGNSTIEEINAEKRKLNMANHPDLGGNATKCKIGNMYFEASRQAESESCLRSGAGSLERLPASPSPTISQGIRRILPTLTTQSAFSTAPSTGQAQ